MFMGNDRFFLLEKENMTVDNHPPAGSRCDEIVALLKKKILLRKSLPGDMFPREETLARQYSVSRALIREALGILKAQGYLESRRGKGGGTFVKDIVQAEEIDSLYTDLVLMGEMTVGDLVEARLLIEPRAAELAAQRITADGLRELSACLWQEGEAESLQERMRANIEFHNTIGRISGNPFFAISIRNFMKFTYLFIIAIGDRTPDIHNDREHQEIFFALKSGNSGLAYERMYVHTSGMKRKMTLLEQMFREIQLKDS